MNVASSYKRVENNAGLSTQYNHFNHDSDTISFFTALKKKYFSSLSFVRYETEYKKKKNG